MEKYQFKSIGIIHTPYAEPKNIPVQGKFKKEVLGKIELYPEYAAGLKDLDGFSHLILLYCFHRSEKAGLLQKPFLEDEEHGVFAIRSPKRPNPIGLSIVKLEAIQKNIITFSEVDLLDQTPLLDIKPYVSHFDFRDGVQSGWVDKHFQKEGIPERAILK